MGAVKKLPAAERVTAVFAKLMPLGIPAESASKSILTVTGPLLTTPDNWTLKRFWEGVGAVNLFEYLELVVAIAKSEPEDQTDWFPK